MQISWSDTYPAAAFTDTHKYPFEIVSHESFAFEAKATLSASLTSKVYSQEL